MSDWLPPLVLLSDYEATEYIEALYRHFRRDFLDSLPRFPHRKMGLKRHPVIEGKEATFWHFISEGNVESDRLLSPRRAERICWPRPIIEAVQTNRVRCWVNVRRNGPAFVLALEDFSYKVVLVDRGDYVLPWTAFYVEYYHQREKLRKEYENALKKLGPFPKGNGPVTPSTPGG